MNQKIDISTSTLLRLVLILLGLVFLFYIRDVLILLFIVIILVAGLSPTVDRWAKYLTRPGAVVLVFFLLVILLGLTSLLIIPPFVEQLRQFSTNLPFYVEDLTRNGRDGILSSVAITLRDNLSNFSSQLGDLGNIILSRTIGVISGIVAVATVLVMTFYLLLEQDGLKKIYKGIIPASWYDSFVEPTKKISSKLGAWLTGQLVLMLAVGISVTVGMLIIGSPYALTLGVWSGLTEAIPIVGPIIGAVPGILVGWAQSPLQGILALVIYTVIQQLENNLLVPRIMAKAVGLNPVIVIVAILIGGKLYGVLGILLSVPAAAIISVLVEDWPNIKGHFERKSSS